MKKNIFVILLLAFLVTLMSVIFTPEKGKGDFLAYWSAAKLMITGQNPYDMEAMRAIQMANRPPDTNPEEITLGPWNPPWLSLVLIPYALLPFQLAVPLWMFTNLLIIGCSLILTLKLLNYPLDGKEFLFGLVGCIFFGETIALLNLGQIGTLVLLALLLGIKWIDLKKDWAAGGILVLATIKPHLSYLMLPVIILWALSHRRWKIPAGFIFTLLASIGITMLFFPAWIPAYFQLITSTPFSELYTSTIGSFLLNVLGIPYFQYIGILGVPLIFLLVKRQPGLGWVTVLNLAALVGVTFAPFGYTFDQIVLLPAIIQIIAWLINDEGRKQIKKIISIIMILANIFLLLLLTISEIPYYWFFWVPMVLLIGYSYMLIILKEEPYNKDSAVSG